MNHCAFATDSQQMSALTTSSKIKYVQIDTTPANLKYFPMNGTGCPATGTTRYVLIGVTQMPNVNYTTTTVSGEFDFKFSQKETPCVTWTYKYKYYSDGSWMWWVNNFNTSQFVCAPVSVVWK